MAFLTNDQLKQLGLKSFGENVLISDKASIYSPHLISIGSPLLAHVCNVCQINS